MQVIIFIIFFVVFLCVACEIWDSGVLYRNKHIKKERRKILEPKAGDIFKTHDTSYILIECEYCGELCYKDRIREPNKVICEECKAKGYWRDYFARK